MSKPIPCNSLVLTVGPSCSHNYASIKDEFPTHEVIWVQNVREELCGDPNRKDIDNIVFSEIHRRVATKLRLGGRVVVCAPNLRKDSRIGLSDIGLTHGVPVFYVVCKNNGASDLNINRFEASERDILRGDGVAEVVNLRAGHTMTVIPKLSLVDLGEYIQNKYKGVTVLGDVHGMYQSFLTSIEWARARNHFVLSLGDIIDYGPDTLECADEMYRLVMRGSGQILLGNHERKIARWIDQNERGRAAMKLSEGNRVTTQALNRAGIVARDRWMSRFRGMVYSTPRTLQIGDYFFAHAAIHPSQWEDASADSREIEGLNLYGEYDRSGDPSVHQPTTYEWVKAIPAGKTVIVGHDVRSTDRPSTDINEQGGRAIFLDTGSGKGGTLSSADLRFNNNGQLELQNFRMN